MAVATVAPEAVVAVCTATPEPEGPETLGASSDVEVNSEFRLSERSRFAAAAARAIGVFAGAVKHNPSRSVTVLKPASYAEVERIAKALKAGDVVVLALRNTPDNLSKRILDFSFGVSSALDASVDCVADKVFVISRGAALTDAERMSLRGQGVL